ncbi:hypothetical protein HYW83_02435 [Candidatus Peregrinibacteria bacterium]|nr:hypothetical protein [Candidatus Peregrinibacteria bacterium]
MKIEKGTSRTAFVGERYTIKFPRPNIKVAVDSLKDYLSIGIRRALPFIRADEDDPFGLSFLLFRGWLQNVREARISDDFINVVVPTRFSLFGFINIQDTAPDVDAQDGEIYIDIIKRIKSSADVRLQDVIDMRSATHTLPNSKNYGLSEGRIKLRDYGEKGIAELLQRFGTQVEQVLQEKMATIQAR